ncbi:MAG: alkaline phosphatase family protein [Terricaulis sp.]
MKLVKSILAVLALGVISLTQAHAQTPAPSNVILVTVDGVRWEELFRGADPSLVVDDATRARFVDVPDRAQALAPFLLSFAQTGTLMGNRDAGSCARVANRFWFSYPGYAEILAGRPNPRVRYNAAIPNDDVTVLERLARRPDFAGQVRVFAAWDAVPAIVNAERSRIPVFTAPSKDLPQDPAVMAAAREAFVTPPRVTWIALGDSDSYAHAGDYAGYLNAIANADSFIRELWQGVEADPARAERTTLIVTTDHGRGASAHNRWRGHGSGLWRWLAVPGLRHEGSDAVFIGARGPRIAISARPQSDCATNGQAAATMLQSLGILDEERQPDMAPPL